VRTDTPGFASAAFASCLTKPLKPAQLHETLVRIISGAKPAARKSSTASKLDPTLAQRLPLHILLCDDNAINQKVALRLLQQMGYKADVAANGIEALAALDRQPYELVFMDVQMPEMDGLEATRQIRERQNNRGAHPNYKANIVIAANAMQGDRERCIAAGMDDYLAKPVRPEEIRSLVERWGSLAAMQESAAPAATSTATNSTLPARTAAPVSSVTDDPNSHVDTGRLQDFTDGNADNLRELATLYLKQTSAQLEQLEAAVQSGAADQVRRLAHSCAGASATCGMVKLVPLLREMERQGQEGKLTNAEDLCRQAVSEFEIIRRILESHPAMRGPVTAPASP
jgi:CheY-like chemotaxis protein